MRAAGWGGACAGVVLAAAAVAEAPWREEFRAASSAWEVREKPSTNVTRYRVDPDGADGSGALLMEGDDASATFATQLEGVALARMPILRWRWRALELPSDADGRDPERDDQAIGIYVSHGGLFGQRSIAYRWETTTPVGAEGTATYVAGLVKVHWIALRNQQDALGTWFTEQRDVAADFQRAFGFVPDDPIIAVTANSQYTGTRAVAELDWIELAPAAAELRKRQ